MQVFEYLWLACIKRMIIMPPENTVLNPHGIASASRHNNTFTSCGFCSPAQSWRGKNGRGGQNPPLKFAPNLTLCWCEKNTNKFEMTEGLGELTNPLMTTGS